MNVVLTGCFPGKSEPRAFALLCEMLSKKPYQPSNVHPFYHRSTTRSEECMGEYWLRETDKQTVDYRQNPFIYECRETLFHARGVHIEMDHWPSEFNENTDNPKKQDDVESASLKVTFTWPQAQAQISQFLDLMIELGIRKLEVKLTGLVIIGAEGVQVSRKMRLGVKQSSEDRLRAVQKSIDILRPKFNREHTHTLEWLRSELAELDD